MSGGVDSSTVAALLVAPGPPHRRPDHAALEPAPSAGAFDRRRDRPLLLARRRLRRPPRGRADRHPVLRGELRAPVRGAGGQAVRRGVPGRPHAHPLHALQQLHQVRPLPRDGGCRWARTAIATGHYARIRCDEPSGRYQLLRAVDASKDQTYFLFGLTQAQLARTLFPLGELTKPEVRELARSMDLAVAAKGDSQEICFVPNGDYAAFMNAYLKETGVAPRSDPRRDRDHRRPHARRARRRPPFHRRPAPRPGHRHRRAALRDRHRPAIAARDRWAATTICCCARFFATDVNWISIAGLTAPRARRR